MYNNELAKLIKDAKQLKEKEAEVHMGFLWFLTL